jgi:hypothetical protein
MNEWNVIDAIAIVESNHRFDAGRRALLAIRRTLVCL